MNKHLLTLQALQLQLWAKLCLLSPTVCIDSLKAKTNMVNVDAGNVGFRLQKK